MLLRIGALDRHINIVEQRLARELAARYRGLESLRDALPRGARPVDEFPVFLPDDGELGLQRLADRTGHIDKFKMQAEMRAVDDAQAALADVRD